MRGKVALVFGITVFLLFFVPVMALKIHDTKILEDPDVVASREAARTIPDPSIPSDSLRLLHQKGPDGEWLIVTRDHPKYRELLVQMLLDADE